MGCNYYAKRIKCECGEDYGRCGKTNIFMFRDQRSTDLGTLFVKYHAENENSEFKHLGTYTIEDIRAIVSVLQGEGEPPTTEELEEVKDNW